MRGGRGSERGFSLVELAVATAVLGVVTTLSYNGIEGLRSRTAARNGVREIVTTLKRARSEAFARGAPVVFFLREATGGRLEYAVIADLDADFDPADIDASLEAGDRVIVRREAPEGVFFRRPGASVFLQPLPAPFDVVPAATPCTFCGTGEPVVVVFRTDGTVRLGRTPADHPIGGSFSLVSFDGRKARPSSDDRAIDKQVVAVVARAGTVQAFDR